MRVAVTGREGQVVSCLIDRGIAAGHEIVAMGRPKFDLTKPKSVMRALEVASPDVIVSAAAYTAVDRAETEPGLAHSVNVIGAATVAQAARDLGVPLVHISTDYVFDGALDRPYLETDFTKPTCVYGVTKLAGEQAVLDVYSEGSAILRTAWVYSAFGGNFVKTILRLAREREEVAVVADQIGNPTSALDIANGVLKVAANMIADSNPALRGIFHMTARGEASWADFAQGILTISGKQAGPSASIKRIATKEYPTAAARPANSRLDCGLIARTHGVKLPDWHDALPIVMACLQPIDQIRNKGT